MSSASDTVGTIEVRVLLFASYAEQAGKARLQINLPSPATVQDVLQHLRALLPAAERLPEHPLAAVNQAHARLNTPVRDGDEVAFLPPMAGG